MRTVGKLIAVEPPESRSLKTEVRSGVAIVQQQAKLLKLVVVLDSSDGAYKAGDFIYLKGSFVKSPFAAETYEEDDKKFILCPVDQIVAHKAG